MLFGIAVIAAGLGVLSHGTHLLRGPEQQTIDTRFLIRGTSPHKLAGIVFVKIDDATIQDLYRHGLKSHLPLPRRYDARVIDQLHRAGAKVIAYDLEFADPTDNGDDNALIEAVGRARNVVLSTTTVGPHGSTRVLGGEKVLRSLGARAGDTHFFPDSDGTYRRIQYSIRGLKTFGVAIAEVDTGRPVHASTMGGAKHPVLIDYAGPPGTVPSIPFSAVFFGKFPRDLFAGKIVIVGDAASVTHDDHPTPTSGAELMPGSEVMANATATVLDGIPLRTPSGWVTVLLIAVLAFLVYVAACAWGHSAWP